MKTKIITITFIVILILGGLLIAGDVFVPRETMKKTVKIPTPTVTVSAPKTNPPVKYDKTSNEKMLQLVEHRQPLSPSDASVKEKLKRLTTPAKTTQNYSIEYVSSPDEFMVEILTVNVNQAKEESVAWLKSQGLSSAGVCHLPIVYYLNYNVANTLRGMNIQFSPLAPGC